MELREIERSVPLGINRLKRSLFVIECVKKPW